MDDKELKELEDIRSRVTAISERLSLLTAEMLTNAANLMERARRLNRLEVRQRES